MGNVAFEKLCRLAHALFQKIDYCICDIFTPAAGCRHSAAPCIRGAVPQESRHVRRRSAPSNCHLSPCWQASLVAIPRIRSPGSATRLNPHRGGIRDDTATHFTSWVVALNVRSYATRSYLATVVRTLLLVGPRFRRSNTIWAEGARNIVDPKLRLIAGLVCGRL